MVTGETLVTLVLKDLLVRRVLPELRDLMAPLGHPEQMDSKELPEHRVLLELLGMQDHREQ